MEFKENEQTSRLMISDYPAHGTSQYQMRCRSLRDEERGGGGGGVRASGILTHSLKCSASATKRGSLTVNLQLLICYP